MGANEGGVALDTFLDLLVLSMWGMREWDDCENTVVIFIVLDWIISPIPYILSSSKSRHGVFFLWKPTGWVVKLIMIMGHKWGELWTLTSSKGMQDIKK